ncbi:MAG: peptidoglycan-binding protein [Maritimibacter sp.]|nr:peptidoglycan-binding protein [Maritimibacter sp.]
MNNILRIVAVAVLSLAPGWGLARDAALIVVTEEYQALPEVDDAPDVRALTRALEAAQFRVTAVTDASPADTRVAVERFRDDAAIADRVFVLVAGHIVHSARDSWLLLRGAETVTDVSVGAEGLPLGPLFDIAAEHPGQAVVMLARAGGEISGPGIAGGPAVEAPQGVTLLSGPGPVLIDVAREIVLRPGTRLRQALVPPPGAVEVSGFLSDALPFLPAEASRGTPPSAPPRDISMELAFWNVVVELDTTPAYQAYLDRYPNGQFRTVARAAITGAALDAEAQAQAAEAALALDRTDRQQIQRNLSLLGYDPRGIDGIFGPGSRTAIKSWQKANGHPENGYLTAPQVRSLAEAAKIRADQLAAEAARRKAEEEQRDTEYWRDTGRGGGEPGLRAYLERYPDGLFADVAEARLAEIERAKRAQAQAAERALWDSVRATDTAASYQGYLDKYPKGLFADEAKARIADLTKDDKAAVIAAAKAEEDQVVGNGVLRLLVENRLAAAGQDPGAIDGRFDKTTRRAIRRFQRDQGLTVTGYVTQATMVRLLAV